ncbi:hypothetical protein C8R43DRAFT_998747 [Mycena crocata]|nr:hypothetical protein C8R43DRAFT_998747 [Mycena crocata]
MQCMKNIGMVYQPELAEEIIKVYPLADAQLIHWPIPPYSWQRTVLCSGLREREAPWERIVLELDVTPQEATWIYMLDAEGCIERAMSFGKYIDCTRVMLAQDLLLKAENRVSVDLGFHTIATAVQQSNCPRALAQGILILLDFFLTLLDLERGHVAAAVERWREDLENLGNGYVIFGIPEHISSFDPYSPFYFLQLIEMQYFHRGFFLDHLPILSKLHDIWFDPDYSTLPADSKVCLDIPEDVLVSCNFTVITHLRSMWVASQTELSFRDWANQAPLITLHKLVAAGVLNDQVMTQTRSLRTFAKAERRKVWAPKQAGWIDEVSTLQELVARGDQ